MKTRSTGPGASSDFNTPRGVLGLTVRTGQSTRLAARPVRFRPHPSMLCCGREHSALTHSQRQLVRRRGRAAARQISTPASTAGSVSPRALPIGSSRSSPTRRAAGSTSCARAGRGTDQARRRSAAPSRPVPGVSRLRGGVPSGRALRAPARETRGQLARRRPRSAGWSPRSAAGRCGTSSRIATACARRPICCGSARRVRPARSCSRRPPDACCRPLRGAAAR
jgi:hypothetical protein